MLTATLPKIVLDVLTLTATDILTLIHSGQLPTVLMHFQPMLHVGQMLTRTVCRTK
jgi:hypothetical protein